MCCNYFIVIVYLFLSFFLVFVSLPFPEKPTSRQQYSAFALFLLIMTPDLKVQPASISSAICGLHRIVIVVLITFQIDVI